MNKNLFVSIMEASVSFHNDMQGTRYKYDREANKVVMGNISVRATEALRKELLREAITNFNIMLYSRPV